jgi:hypothetical protein
MKKNLLFALIVMLAMACSVFAAEWVQIGEKSYMDVSSLAPYKYNYTDITYSIWKKSLNDGTDTWKNLEKRYGKKIGYNKALFVVNCTKKEIGLKSVVEYDLNEHVVDSYESIYPDWSSVVPETNGELMYTLVCSAANTNVQDADRETIQTPTNARIKIKYHKK